MIAVSLFILSLSLSAENELKDNSITIHNVSEETKQIWVSDIEHLIEEGSSLRVPCYQGDSIYIQSSTNIDLLQCGSNKRIDNDY